MFARNAAKRSARQFVKKTFLTSCCFVLTEHKRPADGTEIRIRGRVLGGSVVQRGRLLSGSAIFSRLGGRRGILIRRRRNHGSEIARTRVVAEAGDQLALACQCVGIHVFEVPLLHIAGFDSASAREVSTELSAKAQSASSARIRLNALFMVQ